MTTDRKPVPQRYRILQYIAEVGSITRLAAANHVGAFELASRIGELEAEGVVFKRSRHTTENRYGDTVRYMRYQIDHAPPGLLAEWCDGHEQARINPAVPNRNALAADVTTREALEHLGDRFTEAGRQAAARFREASDRTARLIDSLKAANEQHANRWAGDE